MSIDQFPTHIENEDPLAGDVDRFVHPDETRTDEQIAHDEKYAVESYDDNEGYWDDDDELHDDTPEVGAEAKYDLTEKDIEDRKAATTWLQDAVTDYEKQRDEEFGGIVTQYSGDARAAALNRALDNGFYGTSDDNVSQALHTVETGSLRRAERFTNWPDGSYKAAQGITTTELDLDGLRAFTDRFTDLQRQREEVIATEGVDPIAHQMEEVFGAAGSPR